MNENIYLLAKWFFQEKLVNYREKVLLKNNAI